MKHFICTALVILGLVFQPFAFARSGSLLGPDADNSMQMGRSTTSIDSPSMQSQSTDMAADNALARCHEATSIDANMEDCDDCCSDVGCAMIVHCASTSLASFAILRLGHSLLELDSTKLYVRALSAHAAADPSFFYHPPKHS